MKWKYVMLMGLVAVMLTVGTAIALASSGTQAAEPTIVETVRQVTAQFKDVHAAEAAGYGLFHGCVSAPQDGAMGIHYANSTLVADGALEPSQPEALLYEAKNGTLNLAGVEYLVIADGWNAGHDAPPVLMGQLFNYVAAPNRYGLPAFYELHVWAWHNNPNGLFADWNPRVSCEDYSGETVPMQAQH